jgi:hypothetical protein|tara:strand:- start:1320 stop:1802 length:483 start_codon:yes stop_codon:yes gene_type:complete
MNEKIKSTLLKLENQGLLNGNFKIDEQLIQAYRKVYGKGTLKSKGENFLADRLAALNLLKYKHNKFKASDIKEGFIYVISNPSWEYVKIGRTIDARKRLAQMQTYSPLRDFKIEHYVFSQDINLLEYKVHKYLENSQVNGEWFNVPASVAIKTIKTIMGR